MSVVLYLLDGQRVTGRANYSEAGRRRWTCTEFWYDESGFPSGAKTWGFDDGEHQETARLRAAGATEHFEHDAEGRLERIVGRNDLPGEPEHALYRRPRKRAGKRALESGVADRLEEVVKTAATAADVEERMWCLALLYDHGSPLPPTAHLGSERELLDWGTELNPAEWDAHGPPRRLELNDDWLNEACVELWGAWSTHDDGQRRARTLLNVVAKRLNTVDWSGLLPATEDFFVYAVDLELEELNGNLKAALPSARLAELRDQGALED